VYDGHSIAHGRVLVDSTWHHWFDMNVAALEAANTADFRKIQRYFQNVAIWLSPPAAQQKMLAYAAFWVTLSPAAIEALTPGTPIKILGGQAIDILGRHTSECLVTSWVLDRIELDFREIVRRPPIGPEPCWSCPPEGLFTESIMGGVIQKLLPLRDALVEAAWKTGCDAKEIPFDPERIEALVAEGVVEGLEHVLKSIDANREAFEHATRATKHALAKVSKQRATAQ
jgi:hypothetical protein